MINNIPIDTHGQKSLAIQTEVMPAPTPDNVSQTNTFRSPSPALNRAALTAGLVLGFAAVPEARIAEALQALRKAWRL